MVFSGPAAAILDVQRTAGLSPLADHVFGDEPDQDRRIVVELVISERCPLIGSLVGNGSFRQQYHAAVLAVSRHGERVDHARLGTWTLRAGDCVLVAARHDFVQRNRYHSDFFIVSDLGSAASQAPWHAPFATISVAALVGLAATGIMPLFSSLAAGYISFLITKLLPWHEVKPALDLKLLLTIGAAIGIGHAWQATGLADGLARGVFTLSAGEPVWALIIIYISTVILTECITNNAAAVLMLPLALSCAQRPWGKSHALCHDDHDRCVREFSLPLLVTKPI